MRTSTHPHKYDRKCIIRTFPTWQNGLQNKHVLLQYLRFATQVAKVETPVAKVPAICTPIRTPLFGHVRIFFPRGPSRRMKAYELETL